MNIREYVDNPMGKGDSSIPNRKQLIDSLELKYAKLIKHKGNDIKLHIYKTGNKQDDIYFHLVIPTETERNNTYDVVFLFRDPGKAHRDELSISKYDVLVFSNSPSFAYTFAYVYNKHGLFIHSLAGKLGKEFMKNEPEVRNRYEIINYEKYVYFGARFILDSKRLNRSFMDMVARPYRSDVLTKNIRTLDAIMAEYKKAENVLKRKKKQTANRIDPENRKPSQQRTTSSKLITRKPQKKKVGKISKVKKQ